MWPSASAARPACGPEELGGRPEASEALLSAAGIDPTRRGETLSIDEFVELGRAVIDARGRGTLAPSTAAR